MMAEISITPIGTSRTSVSFYIARALEAVSDMKDIRFQLNSMGTIMESEEAENIFLATQIMMDTIHNLGVNRQSVILKIDSRRDKSASMSEKIKSVQQYMSESPNFLE